MHEKMRPRDRISSAFRYCLSDSDIGILEKEEEKQRCNKCKDEEEIAIIFVMSTSLDSIVLLLFLPKKVSAPPAIARKQACGLALLKKDENNNCDRKKKKDYLQRNLMYCHEVDLQT